MRKTTVAIAAAALAAVGATAAVASDREGRRERETRHGSRERQPRERGARAPADAGARALYRKECGACHLDFPPGFLPAESHRRLLADLERHFGGNAEVDPEVRARLERWLVDNAAEAGTRRLSSKVLGSLRGEVPGRITEVPYFRRKHRGIDAGVTARPAVRSLANCGACHPGANDWDFDDDRAKIPAG